ncbi:MAG TPA: DUF4384 domain-containing protein [Bacteroidia bacterium]|nr:DUF4384 domain-containing protein [Bacteroidia bacterium]
MNRISLVLLPLFSSFVPAVAGETEVLGIFQSKCADCHSNGDEDPELNNGINLTQLLASEDDLKSIIDRIERGDGAKGRMPKSKGNPGDPAYTAPLTAEEIATIKDWAAGAGPASQAKDAAADSASAKPGEEAVRSLISVRDEIRLIAADLDSQQVSGQRFIRYLTLSNLANLRNADGTPVESDQQMETYRAAIGKLANSLSHEGAIHAPVAVDPGRTIFRLDIRSYGWTAEEWEEHIVAFYPYGLRGFDARSENEIEELTGSKAAWVRADWFVFAASQPPLYNRLLRLPGDDRELERSLGVELTENLRRGRALRAGFRESGVSQGNRLIERHELGKYPGAYWKSYDFSPLVREVGHDLFRSPLGPPDAGLTKNKDREFKHDGGEIVWSLRNGLNGYYLSTAAGDQLDRAPTEIVQDKKRRDGAIINGISCIACHDAGIKYTLDKPIEEFRDEVGPIALKAGLDRDEAGMVEALYAPVEKLHQVVLADEERFKRALALAMPGYDQPFDPVSRLYNRFRADVNLSSLAGEFGEQDIDFIRKLKDTRDPDLESIAAQLEAGMGFPRASFLDQFQKIAHAFRYELLPFRPLAYAEYTSGSSKAGGNEGQVMLSDGGKLIISTDKSHYRKGELLTVHLKVTEGAFIRLYHLSAEKKLTQIFPNAGQSENFIRGGKEIRLPESGDSYRFRMGEPFGTEIILAVASPVQFTDTENLTFQEGELFKSFLENDLVGASKKGTKGLTVEVQDVSGKIKGIRTAPAFTARAVFTVGP